MYICLPVQTMRANNPIHYIVTILLRIQPCTRSVHDHDVLCLVPMSTQIVQSVHRMGWAIICPFAHAQGASRCRLPLQP